MDIAAASIVLSQAKLQQNAGIMVMKKAMDTSKQTSDFVSQMLTKVEQPTSTPLVGNKLDVYV